MATHCAESFTLKNGKSIELRHCAPQDAGLFPAFQQKAASETTHTLQIPSRCPPVEKVREVWAENESNPLNLRLGAFYDGKLIGQISLEPLNAQHPWIRHVGMFGMMILEEFWGHGIGSRMLQIIDEHARRVGITRIEAYVRVRNSGGVHLYGKAGYTIEGTRRNAARIDGEYWDEFYIAKLLDDATSGALSPTQLHTERLILRDYRLDDWQAVHEYTSSPEVCAFQAWGPNTDAMTRAFVEDCVREATLPKRRTYNLAITDQSSSQLLGGCALFIQPDGKEAEIGFTLNPRHWGKGFAAEAARALISHAFKELGIHRVFATCRPENTASVRALQKIPMRQEGVLLGQKWIRGQWADSMLFAVLEREWDLSNQP